MDNNEKARRVLEAVSKLEDEYQAEGKPQMAKQLIDAIGQLPVGSLSRLHDILTN